MRHFDDYAGLQAALNLPADAPGAFRFLPQFGPASFRCADCGHGMLNTSGNGGTGYAIARGDVK